MVPPHRNLPLSPPLLSSLRCNGKSRTTCLLRNLSLFPPLWLPGCCCGRLCICFIQIEVFIPGERKNLHEKNNNNNKKDPQGYKNMAMVGYPSNLLSCVRVLQGVPGTHCLWLVSHTRVGILVMRSPLSNPCIHR